MLIFVHIFYLCTTLFIPAFVFPTTDKKWFCGSHGGFAIKYSTSSTDVIRKEETSQ